jgi:hypothetical protein
MNKRKDVKNIKSTKLERSKSWKLKMLKFSWGGLKYIYYEEKMRCVK